MRFSAARAQVLEACTLLADLGHLAGTGGNVALRADASHFAVTPSALDYYGMTAADVCIVRLSDDRQVEGDRPASVEAGLHGAILRARPDCEATIHTHQPIASAYTLLAQPLRPLDASTRALLGNPVPCVGYAPSGTSRLAERVARALPAGTHACLMRNHGAVCVGASADEAMKRVTALESACASFFLARLEPRGAELDASLRRLLDETLVAALAPSGR